MKIQLFHFTRIPGCNKTKKISEINKINYINYINEHKKFLPTLLLPYPFFLHHYQYLEETRTIRHRILVILIPCNNCNEHKIDPENCELILDSKNRVHGVSFKIKEKNPLETYYIVKNDLLGRIRRELVYKCRPILYYNKEKFFQTYEISKEFDLNYSSPFYYERSVWWHRSAPLQKTTYLSVFCPVPEKEIKLKFRNLHEHTTTVKYGWTMFCTCSKYDNDFSQWSICTTKKPNELTLVSCNKPNFNMYILNNNKVPMSLLNLSLSSLYQNNLNSALNLTKYVVPKTLSQQAPPCYLFHLSPFDLSIESHYDCRCYGYYISSHISDW
jgi:hypothetical protein